MDKMLETYRGVAHAWLCDHQGHLNTRNYLAMFDDAIMHFCTVTGLYQTQQAGQETGWVDVRNVLEYKKEVRAGDLLVISSRLQKVGNKSVTVYQEMRCLENNTLRASMEAVLVCFDLINRCALPVNKKQIENALSYLNTMV